MIKGIGKINQVGYVVKDIDAALDYWVNVLGIGPWFLTRDIPVSDYNYRGKELPCKMSVAVANSGDLQIELILDENEGPSWYKEYLEAGREGVNHVSFWQANDEEFDTTYKKLIDSGYVLAQSGNIKGGRFAYFDNPKFPGVVIEISALVGQKGERFKFIANAAKNWDGKDPIR